MFDKKKFSQRLLLIRNSRNIMAKDVAEHLGISKQAISQLEKALTAPTINTLYELADYFDVSLDYLVGRSDDPTRR